MQEGLHEKLLELIKSSSVLTSAEREQWLEILPLMNDKQGSELEGILNTPKPLSQQPQQQARPQPQNHFRPPELHHITNLPTGLNFNPRNLGQPSPTPVKSPVPPLREIKKDTPVPRQMPAASSWKMSLQQKVTEKELPPPEPELDLPLPEAHTAPSPVSATLPVTAAHPTQSVQNLFAPPAAPVPPPPRAPLTPAPHAPLPPPPPPVVSSVVAEEHVDTSRAAVHVTTLADMSNMSISTFQLLGKEGLLDAIALLSRKHGYFPAILAIEESPLYKMYLESGKTLLGPASAVPDSGDHILQKRVLSKQEFEAMNDILQKIQHS